MAVNHNGEVVSVPRQLCIKTKEVRAVLGDPSKLSSVTDVQAQIEKIDQEKAEQFKKTVLAEAIIKAQRFADKLNTLIEKQRL